MSYPHRKIEKKWQTVWENKKCFHVKMDLRKPKFYALSMFPYPSGSGLHVGHLASYTPTDIVARYKRATGCNVLHPMGYDAFGLPAEQYAIQTKLHPFIITSQAIKKFKSQLKAFGFSYNWNREISTCEPEYYKWTQYLFMKFFKKGLAYQKKVSVNWCPKLKTILANEEVIDGKSERGGFPVERVPVKQWLLSITQYADRLLDGLKELDWPDRTKLGQKNWIGKSSGVEINFSIGDKTINVFTTRPDTLYGCTFLVLAVEHPLVLFICTKEQRPLIQDYLKITKQKSDIERKAQVKTGVFTGAFATHPLTGQKLPVWTSDYVLMDYGTGAIMAVPAHDERDFIFARQFNLPVKRIIKSGTLPFSGDGLHIHSPLLDGLNNQEAIQTMKKHIKTKKLGKEVMRYKLKDWVFSRQRYWGEPFPLVHFNNRVQTVPEEELPVTLPKTADYTPSANGAPPLARQKDFVHYKDKKTGLEGKRDCNTMPGSAASSWYFLRYTDPDNKNTPFSFEKQKYWMPVDLYVGGPEHTIGHLLYARFWQKFFYDQGLVSHQEPFRRLVHQGMILGTDNQKMSKSRKNTINPDDLKDQFGADTIRVYITFLGPLEKDKPWSHEGIQGSRHFLERVWRLCFSENGEVLPEKGEVTPQFRALLNHTIQKVTEDINNLNLNTAISSMMIFVNNCYRKQIHNHQALKTLSQLLMPFAPHIAEEIWEALGGEGLVSLAAWPKWTKTLKKESTIGVQVNGKTRDSLVCLPHWEAEQAFKEAQKKEKIKKILQNKKIKKIIYKPGRILNILTT